MNPDDYWAFGAPYNYNKLYVPVRGTLSAGTSRSTRCTFSRFDRARIQLITGNSARTCLNEATFLNSLVPGSNTTNVNVLTNMSNLFNTAGAGTSPASCATETILNEMTRL